MHNIAHTDTETLYSLTLEFNLVFGRRRRRYVIYVDNYDYLYSKMIWNFSLMSEYIGHCKLFHDKIYNEYIIVDVNAHIFYIYSIFHYYLLYVALWNDFFSVTVYLII